MNQFKYTINGKTYEVEIEDINESTNIANVKVNGESFEVGMEKPAEEEKKKVVLGKLAAEPSPPSTLRWATRSRQAMPSLCSRL